MDINSVFVVEWAGRQRVPRGDARPPVWTAAAGPDGHPLHARRRRFALVDGTTSTSLSLLHTLFALVLRLALSCAGTISSSTGGCAVRRPSGENTPSRQTPTSSGGRWCRSPLKSTETLLVCALTQAKWLPMGLYFTCVTCFCGVSNASLSASCSLRLGAERHEQLGGGGRASRGSLHTRTLARAWTVHGALQVPSQSVTVKTERIFFPRKSKGSVTLESSRKELFCGEVSRAIQGVISYGLVERVITVTKSSILE